MCGRCDRQASEELGRTPGELARPRPLEERLREAFVKYLTQDVMAKGKRAKKWESLAIFDPERGYAIWTSTNLQDVLDKFDLAMENVEPW